MLIELLRLLNTGGLQTMDGAARQLGVSEGLIAEMADNLASRGYLVPLGSHCGDSCSGCSFASMCGLPGTAQPRILMLTEKGRRAVATAA